LEEVIDDLNERLEESYCAASQVGELKSAAKELICRINRYISLRNSMQDDPER
jgi:hypothetical protein